MGFTALAKKAAPWITTAVGLAVPGAAPLANVAAKLLSTGLNTNIKPDAQSISDAIATAMATPEQLSALKKIDDDFAMQMKQLDIQSIEDLEKIAADDRASARSMQVQTRSIIPAVLAVVVTLGFFGVLGFMLKYPIPAQGHDAMLIMLGGLGAAWTAITNYYFGSSAGSAHKTELLAQAPPVQR